MSMAKKGLKVIVFVFKVSYILDAFIYRYPVTP